MEINSIQMADSAGHVVAYTIGPIIKHIIDCVQPYKTNKIVAFGAQKTSSDWNGKTF